ncbi:MAG: hypothetical protein ACYC0J_10030 [Gammaproteobacteria bacterium]
MAKFVYQGVEQEFPDDASIEEINAALGINANSGEASSDNSARSEVKERLKKAMNVGSSPATHIQDFAGGVAKGAQNIAALLGEGGQAIASGLTGGYAPTTDIREEMGLGKDRPVDLGGLIASKNPNPLIMGAGQYAPAIAYGGASIPGQAISAGMYGMTQADPDEQNMFGLLPNGRIGRGISDAVSTLALGGLGKELLSGLPKTRAVIDKARPAKYSRELMNDLGGLANSEVNAERVATDINKSAQAQKEDALSHQKNVMGQVGKSKINASSRNELPEGNLDKVIKAFGYNPEDIHPEDVSEITSSLKSFRKHNDMDRFIDEVGESLGPKEITEKQQQNIKNMLEVPIEKDLNYLAKDNMKNTEYYNGKLEDIHDSFVKNPTFKNAHELESQLGYRERELTKLSKKGTLDRAGGIELQAISKSKKALKSDMADVIGKLPEDLQQDWNLFKKKYRENYTPYESTIPLAKISKGETVGTRPETLKKIFSYPNEKSQKILADLPEETKKNILYNELTDIDPSDARSVVELLDKLEQEKGYAKLFTPEIKKSRDAIKVRLRNKGFATLGISPMSSKIIHALKAAVKR